MNLDKSINSLSQRLNKLYPGTTSGSSNNCNDGLNYWKGKRIISLNQWFKIKQDYTLEAALQYFPDDFLSVVFPFNMDSIDNPNKERIVKDLFKIQEGYKEISFDTI